MFSVTRTYKATQIHPRGSIRLSDVCLSDAAFRDRKSLGAQLRSAGILMSGVRVSSFTGEAGGRVVVQRAASEGDGAPLPIILECIPFDMPHARLAMGKAEPGQTIETDEVVITTALHRFG